jgi:membrane peptidoglycan carboxypeptidase
MIHNVSPDSSGSNNRTNKPSSERYSGIAIEPPHSHQPRTAKRNRQSPKKPGTEKQPSPVKRSPRKSHIPWLWLLFFTVVLGACGAAIYYEVLTSNLQARYISRFATKLTYQVKPGPSDSIVFPKNGPYDKRLGYVFMPAILERIQQQGLAISRQSHFSPDLYNYAQKGLYIPYKEKSQAGLNIVDTNHKTIYKIATPVRVYKDFYDIPYAVIQSLLFIENRGLLSTANPKANPAVEWGRFAKAVVFRTGEMLHLDMPAIGGSTLATQTEKFRHTEGGITSTASDKLIQMASASVRAYSNGEDTTEYRKQLILDYVNSVPLSGAPDYGEVNGLGDGMYVWYGTSFEETNRLLNLKNPTAQELEMKARVLKQVISLMIAHRRPSYYLVKGRKDLAVLANSYVRLLTQEGIIPSALGEAAQTQPIFFRDFKNQTVAPHFAQNKGVNVVRNRIAALFKTSLYALDRMDVSVVSTLDRELQEEVSGYLKSIQEPGFAQEKGLIGKYLLSPDQTDELSYSFTLFERTPAGNMVRVQTDTTTLPFDINEGSKLELGSTAKLRTLATYLEIIAELYGELSPRLPRELVKLINNNPDALTLWVCNQLIWQPGIALKPLLEASMQRTYSANPSERFFTGGGIHVFGNFRKEDNNRYATVTESLQYSLNLPFVRIMQDIVRYTVAKQWENNRQLMLDDNDPRRKEVLDTFIDRESRVFLRRYWTKYAGKTTEQRLTAALSSIKSTALKLTIIHRHLFPQADVKSYIDFIRAQLPATTLSNKQLANMYEKYKPGAYSLQDFGYLASIHPLELWIIGYLQQPGEPTLKDAITKSEQTRQDVYGWLLRTKAKNARDSRIRTVLEIDAFSDIHRRWKNMGYPFDQLVPSLATALGSSGDRPAALAELVGIILSDGKRFSTYRFSSVLFGQNTPYETLLEQPPPKVTQVLLPEVADILKTTMSKVVNEGTAKRLVNVFQQADGTPLVMGGKTGTGDNRIFTSTSSGYRSSSRALNRTATFVFFLGDNYFGTLTTFVSGRSANAFSFTSALPLQVLKGMAPILQPYISQSIGTNQ